MKVRVSFDAKKAWVVVGKDGPQAATLIKTVEATGYKAQPVSPKTMPAAPEL